MRESPWNLEMIALFRHLSFPTPGPDLEVDSFFNKNQSCTSTYKYLHTHNKNNNKVLRDS